MLIYGIKNKESGATVYVGQTVRSLSSRWNQHLRDSSKLEYPLYRAIRKYGADNFEAYVIEECPNADAMSAREIELIKEFNTLTPNGYNLMLGQKGGRHSAETKKKMSVSAKAWGFGTWERSETNNQANRERALRQFSNPEKKKNHLIGNGSKEFNVYRAITDAKKHSAHKNLQKGDLVGSWLSSVDCGKDLNLSHKVIRKALKGKIKTYSGLIFEYKEI